jgi:hypothetical protein
VGNSLDGVDSLVLELLGSGGRRTFLAALPHEDTGNLDGTNTSEEEVDGGKPTSYVALAFVPGNLAVGVHIQNVAGLDDHTPASPDGTGTHEGGILGEGELLSGTGEVGDTGDDEAPLSKMLVTVVKSQYKKLPAMEYFPSTIRYLWEVLGGKAAIR